MKKETKKKGKGVYLTNLYVPLLLSTCCTCPHPIVCRHCLSLSVICRHCLLSLSVVVVCCHCLLSLSVICHLLLSSVICHRCLSSVVVVCHLSSSSLSVIVVCHLSLSLSVVVICHRRLLSLSHVMCRGSFVCRVCRVSSCVVICPHPSRGEGHSIGIGYPAVVWCTDMKAIPSHSRTKAGPDTQVCSATTYI